METAFTKKRRFKQPGIKFAKTTLGIIFSLFTPFCSSFELKFVAKKEIGKMFNLFLLLMVLFRSNLFDF